jgi:hypothetical protein
MDEQIARQSGVPFSAEEIAAHAEHDHLAAVFPDRSHAEAAVEALRALGLGSEHLGVAVHGSDTVVFEHDADRELFRDVEVGAAAGAPLGALAGLALATLTVPGIAVGGILALAGIGAGWGAFLGGSVGLGVGDKASIEHEDMQFAALQPGEVLVVVCSHGHPDAIRETMQRHEGRIRSFGSPSV